MTDKEFEEFWLKCADEIGDQFHPKGKSKTRGEFLRDQAMLYVKVRTLLKEKGFIE